MEIKGRRSGRLEEYTSPTAQYVGDKGRRVWQLAIPVDMAFPCATQHELDRDDAVALAEHGCKYVFEGEDRAEARAGWQASPGSRTMPAGLPAWRQPSAAAFSHPPSSLPATAGL